MRPTAETASLAAPEGEPALGAPPKANRLFSLRALLRLVVVALLLVAVFVVANKFLSMRTFVQSLTTFDKLYLVPILALGFLYYLFKALRWYYYLRVADVRVSAARAVAAYLAGQWFTFTPAGELMRGYLLGGGTQFTQVAPTVVAQAVADFISLALVATAIVPLYPDLAPIVLPVTVPLLLTAIMMAAPPLRGLAKSWSVTQWLASGKRRESMEQAAHLLAARHLAAGILMGIPTVLVGGLSLYFAGVAISLPQWGWLEAEGVYAIMQLLGGVSPLPQGLGVTEGSGALILSYLGIEPAEALAAVLLFRFAILGFSALLGLLAFVVLRVCD